MHVCARTYTWEKVLGIPLLPPPPETSRSLTGSAVTLQTLLTRENGKVPLSAIGNPQLWVWMGLGMLGLLRREAVRGGFDLVCVKWRSKVVNDGNGPVSRGAAARQAHRVAAECPEGMGLQTSEVCRTCRSWPWKISTGQVIVSGLCVN